MANTMHIPFEQIDMNKVTLKKPASKAGAKENKYGEIFNIRYNDGPLRFVGADMQTAFSPKVLESGKLTMCLSFKGIEEDVKLQKFKDFLRRLDEKIRNLIIEMGPAMYPKDKSYKKTATDAIKQRYKGSIKSSVDDDGNPYPDRFDLNIPRSQTDPEKFNDYLGKSFIVDKKDKTVPVTVSSIGSSIVRGTKLRPIAELAFVFVKHMAPYDTTIKYNLLHAMKMSTNDVLNWSLKNDNDADDDETDDDSTKAHAAVSEKDDDKGEEVEYVEQEVTDSEDESEDEQVEAST